MKKKRREGGKEERKEKKEGGKEGIKERGGKEERKERGGKRREERKGKQERKERRGNKKGKSILRGGNTDGSISYHKCCDLPATYLRRPQRITAAPSPKQRFGLGIRYGVWQQGGKQ